MIEEAYVSFDTAKLLDEKEFDEKCRSFFTDYGNEVRYNPFPIMRRHLSRGRQYLRPTQQMAMCWLREVHNIHIYIQAFLTTEVLEGYVAYYISDKEFMWRTLPMKDSYEEATDAAIKYCLENLI